MALDSDIVSDVDHDRLRQGVRLLSALRLLLAGLPGTWRVEVRSEPEWLVEILGPDGFDWPLVGTGVGHSPLSVCQLVEDTLQRAGFAG